MFLHQIMKFCFKNNKYWMRRNNFNFKNKIKTKIKIKTKAWNNNRTNLKNLVNFFQTNYFLKNKMWMNKKSQKCVVECNKKLITIL